MDIEDRIRALAVEHGTQLVGTVDTLFAYDSDASAKLMQLALDGHVVPTRVASGGWDRQLWEFSLDGDLYLLTVSGEITEGFEPKDAGSFDRMIGHWGDYDLHTFAENEPAAAEAT